MIFPLNFANWKHCRCVEQLGRLGRVHSLMWRGRTEQVRKGLCPLSLKVDNIGESDKFRQSKKCVICRLRTCPDNACEGEPEEKRVCGSGEFLFLLIYTIAHTTTEQ